MVGEAIDEASPQSGGREIIAGAGGLLRGKEKGGRHRSALRRRIRRLLRGGAGAREVTQAGQALGLLEQRVFRDGGGDAADLAELALGLGPVAGAVGRHRGREELPRLGERRTGAAPPPARRRSRRAR